MSLPAAPSGPLDPRGNRKRISVAVACSDARGVPDVLIVKVHVTEAEREAAFHYDIAQAIVEGMGYSGPFVCFDQSERAPLLRSFVALEIAAAQGGWPVPSEPKAAGEGQAATNATGSAS